MNDHLDLFKCPLCDGQGDVRRYQLIEFFADPQLQAKIQAYLKDVTTAPETTPELVGAPAEPRDFQKEVHSWNPQLPMWRRSPKE